MSDSPFERHIPFEGCFNFRDLGGYHTSDGRTVRWRRIFRSARLQLLTERDAVRIRDEIGITAVIDLRQRRSSGFAGRGPLAEPPTRYQIIPLYDEDITQAAEKLRAVNNLAERYAQQLRGPEFGRRVVEAMTAIIEPDAGPTVFCCTMGKDRTGMLAALILGALGVGDEEIIGDYALSDKYVVEAYDALRTDPEQVANLELLPSHAFEALPETMETMLTTLRQEYGSIRGYLEAGGADQSLFQRLEEALIE